MQVSAYVNWLSFVNHDVQMPLSSYFLPFVTPMSKRRVLKVLLTIGTGHQVTTGDNLTIHFTSMYHRLRASHLQLVIGSMPLKCITLENQYHVSSLSFFSLRPTFSTKNGFSLGVFRKIDTTCGTKQNFNIGIRDKMTLGVAGE